MTKLNPNEQNLQNTTDNVFNLSPQVQQQLNETVFKKNYKTTNNSTNSTRNYFKYCSKNGKKTFDDDEFDSFKKSEPTAINIGQPKDKNYDDLLMISDDDEAKISKPLFKTDIEIKNKNDLKWKKN